VVISTLVWPKHDGVRSLVLEQLQVLRRLILGARIHRQQLEVGTSALLSILEVDLVLDDERTVTEVERLFKQGRDGRVLGFGLEHKAHVALDGVTQRLFDTPLTIVLGDRFVLLVLFCLRLDPTLFENVRVVKVLVKVEVTLGKGTEVFLFRRRCTAGLCTGWRCFLDLPNGVISFVCFN